MNQSVTDITTLKTALQTTAKQAIFAQIIGISQPAISEHIKNGVLTPNATYAQWLLQYCEHLRSIASGRPEGNDDLKQATIREKTAKARKAEVDTARELGQLVRVDGIREKLILVFNHLSSVLSTCENSILEQIKLEHGLELPKGIIGKHHTAALSELANFTRPTHDSNAG